MDVYTATLETQSLNFYESSELAPPNYSEAAQTVWGGEQITEGPIASGSLSPVIQLPTSLPIQEVAMPLPPECTAPITDLRQESPFRPVDWRWQRACHLVANRQSRRLEDGYLSTAFRFRLAQLLWQGQRGETDRLEAAPAVTVAHAIYSRPADALKWELEARLLAGEMFDSIGTKLALTPVAVKWYAGLFFHVRDRLKAPGYITHRVIRLHEDGGPKTTELDRLWKLYGYWGGPLVLDELIRDIPALPTPVTREEVENFLRTDIRSLVQRRAAWVLRTMPLSDPKVALKVVKLLVQLRELEARQKAEGASAHSVPNIQQNVQVFCSQSAYMEARLAKPEVPANDALRTMAKVLRAPVLDDDNDYL